MHRRGLHNSAGCSRPLKGGTWPGVRREGVHVSIQSCHLPGVGSGHHGRTVIRWSSPPTTSRCCERAKSSIERLATDRHYFAHPARTLFADIRWYFPITRASCPRVVEPYLAWPTLLLASSRKRLRHPREPAACRATTRKGSPASGCRCPTTATARRTSIWPRPRSRARRLKPLKAARSGREQTNPSQ